MPDDDDDRTDETEAALDTIAAASGSDKRGIDFLQRSEQELDAMEAELDPAERAELAMWFAKPSREIVEEQVAKVVAAQSLEDEVLDAKFKKQQEAVAAAALAIQPWMYALLERHHAGPDRMFTPLPPLTSRLDESIFRVRPVTADEIADARDYQRAPDIDDALAENVPQAVLRDLYRAETEFPLRLESPYDEPPPDDGRAEVQAALRDNYRLPRLPTFYEIVVDARKLFAELIAGSWVEKVGVIKALRDVEGR